MWNSQKKSSNRSRRNRPSGSSAVGHRPGSIDRPIGFEALENRVVLSAAPAVMRLNLLLRLPLAQDFHTPQPAAAEKPLVDPNLAPLARNATTVTVYGSHFDARKGHNSVSFDGGVTGRVMKATPTSLLIGLTRAPTNLGVLSAVVTTNGRKSNLPVAAATIVDRPSITKSTVALADNAATLIIHGAGFDPTNRTNTVRLSGNATGTILTASASELTVNLTKLPNRRGPLSAVVESFGGTTGRMATVATIVAKPTIKTGSLLLPADATTLEIKGTGFDRIAANNAVTFNLGAEGAVVQATATTLLVSLTARPTDDGPLTAVISTHGGTSGAARQVATVPPRPAAAPAFNYVVGALFPRRSDGSPNVITASGISYDPKTSTFVATGNKPKGTLNTTLRISTDPITIPGVDRFLNDYYLPQITAKSPADPRSTNSIFTEYYTELVSLYTHLARNRAVAAAKVIGYVGLGATNDASTESYWTAVGTTDDALYPEISNLANYHPEALWQSYQGQNTVASDFDTEALLENLAAMHTPGSVADPKLWYPVFLSTYEQLIAGDQGYGASYPGPLLMVQPGDTMNLHMQNRLSIPGLTEQQNQQASLVLSSSYGNNTSHVAGQNSTNMHFHGSHTNPGGFGDNVLARYTSGQDWTTVIQLPENHGKGSYWYHPHYHPSVNEQVYGGLTGAMQVGDPLSQIPGLENTPRNLAQFKNLEIGYDPISGQLVPAALDNLAGLINRMNMVTVNGEFQPTVQPGVGGWQSLTVTNESNNAYFNIALSHTAPDGKKSHLPLYIYGEDGHQLPQIRRIAGALGQDSIIAPTAYTQADFIQSMPAGKRYDFLVYLPEGKTEMESIQSFTQFDAANGAEKTFSINNMGAYSFTRKNDFPGPNFAYNIDNINGGYPNLSSEATGFGKPYSGPGPLAIFNVAAKTPALSAAQQDAFIAATNAHIPVQYVTPDTKAADYDTNAVPSVNLFAKASDGTDVWKPIRDREFNFAIWTLVGPPGERDAATQKTLAEYTATTGQIYRNYTELPVSSLQDGWLGYGNPFLINDHVYPNGNLTIAQLGTVEQWEIKNWSNGQPAQYIAHPFHIHINDYQVKAADTELAANRSLEDVTMLNSSGYRYFDTTTGQILEQKPLKGVFYPIAEATDPTTVDSLNTFGATSTTIRMLYQDFLGTYVYHCHILVHEDAGMMQAVKVIENTDSSWIVPAEFPAAITTINPWQDRAEQTINVRLAQSYRPYAIHLTGAAGTTARRAQVGDINHDYVQDVLVSAAGSGAVTIVDGRTLLETGKTKVLSSITPAVSDLAPWAFSEDFSGDGQRDVVTGAFLKHGAGNTVSLHDFQIQAWDSPGGTGNAFTQEFAFNPWESITHHGVAASGSAAMPGHDHTESSISPVAGLTAQQTSMVVGDFNFDNFNDYALLYKVNDGVRVTILDGAAVTLLYQTGKLEGGYLPATNILADAVISDAALRDATSLVLTAGYNRFAQGPLDNLLITAQTPSGSTAYTLQLNAGHFIATSETSSSSHAGHGSATAFPHDEMVVNLGNPLTPLHLVAIDRLATDQSAATPVFSAALANGGLLVDTSLYLPQGNGADGLKPTSDAMENTADQLPIDLRGIDAIDGGDLEGIRQSWLQTTFGASQSRARSNVVNLATIAYTGGLSTPSATAYWAAATLGKQQSIAEFVEQFLADPKVATRAASHFGGSLASTPVAVIVRTTFETLYGRQPQPSETLAWTTAIEAGLDKAFLPVAILLNTNETDAIRVALLSAASQWSNAQWGNDANVYGSFSQGIKSADARFRQLEQIVLSTPALASWKQAQQRLDTFMRTSTKLLSGTRVSNTGFF